MIRLIRSSTIAALLLAAGPAVAAPRPDEKPGGPPIIGQAKSLNDLLELTKAMVKGMGGPELYKMFEKELLPNLDPRKLPGIDPKRPFGVYGLLDAKLENWRGVILIPVTSEKEFLDMLEQFDIKTVKGKEAGTFDVVVPPDFPIPVSVRIHKEYAYVAVGGFDVLDLKVILDPKDVINDKEKAAGYLALRLDRITPETKKALHAIARDQIENLKEMIPEPDLKDAFHSAEKLALRWLKTLFDEGKEVTLRIDADTKTGDVFADLTVEGMPKSPLAELFAQRKPTTNAFASLAGSDYVQRMFVKAPLFAEEAKEGFAKLIDFGSKEAVKEATRQNAPVEVVQLIEAAFKSLKATVESGEMDLAAAIRGPNKEGFYTAVAAVHCKETAQLEKATRAAVKTLPAREQGYFKFDAGKIGDLSVHEIDLSAEAGDIVLRIFGKGQTAYFAFGKDALYAAYGPDGMKLLKEAVAAKPAPAAVLDQTADGKKMADLVKRLLPDDDPNAGRAFFGPGWMETMGSGLKVTVDGGDKLKIRVTYNFGLMFLFLGRSAAAVQAK
jgi:hypothetical protein